MTETGVERMLRLYEAKMIHHYDHRWATYVRNGSTRGVTLEEKTGSRVRRHASLLGAGGSCSPSPRRQVDADWLLGWRDICRSTDERTMISAINGRAASPEGGTLLALCDPPRLAPSLVAQRNSSAFDYVARQKVGGTHLKYFTVRQLPLLAPGQLELPTPWSSSDTIRVWLERRVLALVLDARDMTELADDFDARLNADAWDLKRRRALRAEIDAAVFRLYGIERDDVDYIMETFPIIKRKDIAAHGEYRTKRLIAEIYDAMAEAERTGVAYVPAFDVAAS